MKTICVSDKQGNLIVTINTYDDNTFKLLFKQLKRNKKLNVYERR